MMRDLSVTFVQADTRWHSPKENLQLFADLLATSQASDLIVLPEMFTTGFTMAAPEQAEPMDGPGMIWLAEQASRYSCVVTATLVIRDEGRFYNRLIWMRPDGSFASYDKRHLFRMADEHLYYTAGTQRTIVTLNEWRICPLVCYDLRFPVWSRNQVGNQQYDVLLYLANWPDPRRNAWNTLLEARAIENLAYVVGVNRVGQDANGLNYAGDSRAIDFKGHIMADAGSAQGVQKVVFSADQLQRFRKKFPVDLDADTYTVMVSND